MVSLQNRNITSFISNLLFIQLKKKKLQELFTETIYLQTHKNTYINTRNKQKAHTKAKQEKNQSACKIKKNDKDHASKKTVVLVPGKTSE